MNLTRSLLRLYLKNDIQRYSEVVKNVKISSLKKTGALFDITLKPDCRGNIMFFNPLFSRVMIVRVTADYIRITLSMSDGQMDSAFRYLVMKDLI